MHIKIIVYIVPFVIKSPKRSLETLFLKAVSSFSSFLPLNLSIAFLRDGWTELYTTQGYDRPAYPVLNFEFIVFKLGLGNHSFGGQIGVGSNTESVGENYTLYCKWLSLENR